jgi:hypothetical protein
LDRFDYELGLAAGLSAVVVGFAAFFNILQSSLQIIGVGTAISLGLGAVRLRSERRENQRRIRNERILRLMPTVYNPLWKWAKTNKREMAKYDPDELYNPVQGPPDLEVEGDFAAIVGDTLKQTVQDAVSIHLRYSQLWEKVRKEYWDALQSEMNKHGIGDDLSQVSLRIGQQNFPLQYAPFNYTLKWMREAIATAPQVFLAYPKAPNNQIPCPDDVLNTVKNPQDLPSFKEFLEAKGRLASLMDSLIALLSDALAEGEKDWKLAG